MPDKDERPNEGYPITVAITRMSDGKTVEYHSEWGYPGYVRERDWEFDCVNIYTDGNFSCDCNLGMFFDEELGLPDVAHDCSDDKYKVEWIRNDETKRMVYQDKP